MRLLDLAESFFLERQVSKKYRSAVLKTLRQLGEFLGRPADVTDFSRDTLNRWLASIEKTHKPDTIRTKRVILGTLWRAANDRRLAGPVEPLRRLRVAQRVPEALTVEEVEKLIAYADRIQGTFQFTNVSKRLYWKSLYMAYWDTALRISDLRSIERDWIWPGGFISIVQSKTGKTHRVQLRKETIAVIDELIGNRKTGLIWSVLSERNFFSAQKKLFAAAGVRGTGKWIRRASASYVERDRPGMGWRHLGHARPGLAERAYIDPRIVAASPTLPPAIGRKGTRRKTG